MHTPVLEGRGSAPLVDRPSLLGMAQSRPSAPRGVPPPGPTMIGPRTHESHNIHADTTRPRSHTHFYILDVCAYAFFAQGPGPNPRHGPWRTWSSSVRWGALMQQVLRHRTRVLLPISPILPLVSASGARVLVLEQWVAFGDSLKVGPFFRLRVGRALICLGCVFWRAFRSDQTKACAARTLPTR